MKTTTIKSIVKLILFLLILFSQKLFSQCPTPPGDQTSYGANSWIGYVYNAVNSSNPPTNAFTTTYRGYVTQADIFNLDLGTGAISGATLCGTYSDQFSVRFKMQKNFAAGNYSFIVGGDDGYRLSFDGGATFPITNWTDHGYTTTTSTYYLSGVTDMVLEYYEQGGISRVSFSYANCASPSTAPTGISGTTSICSGLSTTLTAAGGTLATGAVYEWGTGTTIGNNILSGQTTAAITVTPATTTTYWVRRVDPAPCAIATTGISQTVTVTTASTAPASITGTTTVCLGNSTTLTASGGTLGTNGTYEWGTGTVGSNSISGQTTASISVNPTVTTTYWVRRVDGAPCSNTTTGATTTVTVNIPTGDQTSYGSNSWIGYVYSGLNTSNPPTNAFTATYRGYVTQTEIFDQDITTGSLSGANLCGTYADQFSIRFKMMRNFTAGYYTFTIGGDDGCRLSLDGGATYVINNFVDHSYTTYTSATVYLSGNTNLVLDYYEQGGSSRVSFNYTSCTNFSSAPTGMTGTTSLCFGTGGTTLTATGGYEAPGATYQWGTGSVVGSNIITGVSYNGYYVNPNTTTTYWVRRLDGAPCNLSTTGYVQTINVATASTNPTSITTANSTVCSGTSITLTATGGTLGTGGSYEWGTGYTVGSNTISGQTAATLTIAPTTSTVYWVRRVDPAPCNSQTPGTTISITVATPPTNPTSISAATTSTCSGTSFALTAIGGNTGTNGTYQWGTGAVGSNIIAGQTYYIMWVNPTVTTTYWVRILDIAPCNATTTGVTQTITVSTPSSAPTTISGSTTTCSGANLTLTASGGTMGSGAVYQWGSGSSVGSNIISGQTAATIVVNPTTSGSFWVRRLDPAPCNTQTSGPTIYITVNTPSTAPTSITGTGASACAGNSTTLSAAGGTAASGSTYQWGTGSTVGSNIISGQTGISITVAPTTTTTYWVRRYDASCSTYTTGVTTTVSITAAPGDPTVAGNNIWNAYGYSSADITLATATYAGYYTSSTLNFDTQNGTNSWASSASPSSAAGWSGCTVPVDNFTFVAKRKGFPCGTYTVAMQNWDDSAQLYLNGTLIWSNGGWSGAGNYNVVVGSYTLDSTSEVEVRIRENTGNANVSLTLTNTNIASTAPTSITGTTVICASGSTTLTATGGTIGTTGSYEWGTGSIVGSNIISGQTTASLNVSPTSDTTYWVRRKDTVCGNTTTGISQLVTITTATVAGTLSTSATTICRNTAPGAIVLSGNTGNVIKWQYATDSGFTSGVTDIVSTATTLSSATIGTLAATRYFRAVVQNGSCTIVTTPSIGITIPASVTYSNGSWSGTPTNTTPVVISSNLTLGSSLNVCSCQVTNTAIVTVPANITLLVQNDLTVASTANIIIENNGSLVQVNNSASNIGNITFKRNTTPLKQYDYTYWASPLAVQTLSQLASPSLFYSFNPNINNWSYEASTTAMAVAKGYISRVPNNLNFATPQVVTATFTGVPNNGIISAPIIKGTGTFNLIGNPYPSAIDIDAFLLDSANTGVVNGTIYLWTHNTAIANSVPGTSIYNYTRDDYAKYNITGGVKTASTAISGGAEPTGKIASGQAFFIEANTSLVAGTYSATFKNSMRLINNNDQFFKADAGNHHEPIAGTIQKNRVWLNITNATGAYDEALVGYITGATDGFDNLFDGKTFPAGNVVSIYSVMDSSNYSIQGRALPFHDNDIIPLGISTTISGNFSIDLEHFDGLFQNQNVYLLDKSTGEYHDLKVSPYSFTITNGTYNDRFELRFASTTLEIDTPIAAENEVKIIKNANHIEVSNDSFGIEAVQLFDLLGKMLYSAKKINSNEFKTADFNIQTQIVIVKVTLDNGQIVTKKVLFSRE